MASGLKSLIVRRPVMAVERSMVAGNVRPSPRRGKQARGQRRVGRRFRRMKKTLRLTVLCAGLAMAGCANDPNATADVEGDRAPLTTPSTNTMNSPTAGPTSDGLSGGTNESAPPEINTRPTRTY